VLGRWAFSSLKLLKASANVIGAKVVDTLMIGLIAQKSQPTIEQNDQKRVRKVTLKLHQALSK